MVDKEFKKLISITPVILCDGSRTILRLLYRTGLIKPFMRLTSKVSLFQREALGLPSLVTTDI